jgi:hypothetical protein
MLVLTSGVTNKKALISKLNTVNTSPMKIASPATATVTFWKIAWKHVWVSSHPLAWTLSISTSNYHSLSFFAAFLLAFIHLSFLSTFFQPRLLLLFYLTPNFFIFLATMTHHLLHVYFTSGSFSFFIQTLFQALCSAWTQRARLSVHYILVRWRSSFKFKTAASWMKY